MPEPMVREIGRVADIDSDPTIIGVDHETVTIEPMVGQARLDASRKLLDFGVLPDPDNR